MIFRLSAPYPHLLDNDEFCLHLSPIFFYNYQVKSVLWKKIKTVKETKIVKFKGLCCNKFNFIQKSQKGGGFALCAVCGSDFIFEHEVENNSNRHKDTWKHKRYVDAAQQQESITSSGASSAAEQLFFWLSGWAQQPPFENWRSHC